MISSGSAGGNIWAEDNRREFSVDESGDLVGEQFHFSGSASRRPPRYHPVDQALPTLIIDRRRGLGDA
jgi:hypothetical protein